MKTYRPTATHTWLVYLKAEDNDGISREIDKVKLIGFTKSGKSAIVKAYWHGICYFEKQYRIQFIPGDGGYIRIGKSRFGVLEEVIA